MEIIPIWKTVFLGALQGATEFLPVSSSAHLVIFQQWMNISQDGAFLLALDVALHFGTLAAVVLFYRKDLKDILFTSRKLGLWLILGTLPAAVFGILLKDYFERSFASAAWAGFQLMITGVILWATRWIKKEGAPLETMSLKQSLEVGVAQAVAILPGISRSGTTIAAGLFIGLTPAAAVRFSFLLSIPAIGGACLLEAKELAVLNYGVLFPILLGVVVSFVIGYFSIRWMVGLVQRHHLHYFAWYCWAFGLLAILKELFF
ncbi:MAG: undecaprenyl-diphosphate phosphatase [Deltaproteobacteria bacterium]|nr:undecaprenyl-diphosphate phosphatase [Deltaproteobacteria bacterium]